MRNARLPRVFVKLQHGSAAAGTVALATSNLGMSAITTVEMVRSGEETKLYNSRRLLRITRPTEIAQLIDALAPHGLHVEAWIPKASIEGRSADLRVLAIGGDTALRVLRTSEHPITNLHLGGARHDAALLLNRMPASAVAALDATVAGVARLLPGALQLGIDIAVAAGFKRHYVLEVNAFGDLLNGVSRDGLNAYDLQVHAMEAGPWHK